MPTSEVDLSTLFRQGTMVEHETLDKRIMALAPFSSRERYTLFVRTQARLHRVVSFWYRSEAMAPWFSDLGQRDRLEAVLSDCRDFNVSSQALEEDTKAAKKAQVKDRHTALGWLYTVEGSNLGAAFLLKHAKANLGLTETFGARHLAGHEHGRGLFWKRFKEQLNRIELADRERQMALAGAQSAFMFAREGVEAVLAPAVADVV